jgi:hypothetical protein
MQKPQWRFRNLNGATTIFRNVDGALGVEPQATPDSGDSWPSGILMTKAAASRNQFDLLAVVFGTCFRLNLRSKSGQNSFRTLDAMSTPICIPSFDTP